MKTILRFLFILMIVLTIVAYQVFFMESDSSKELYYEVGKMKIAETEIEVEISDTDEKRVRGLSGRDNLDYNKGMLFVFDSPDLHGIWMKDMKFPIDVIWLDEFREVVYIEKNMTPDSFPKIFKTPKLALYVLEVRSGFVEENSVNTGDIFGFR